MTVEDLIEKLREMPETAVAWVEHRARNEDGDRYVARRELLDIEYSRGYVVISVGRKE